VSWRHGSQRVRGPTHVPEIHLDGLGLGDALHVSGIHEEVKLKTADPYAGVESKARLLELPCDPVVKTHFALHLSMSWPEKGPFEEGPSAPILA
jgi:hypothetical protein